MKRQILLVLIVISFVAILFIGNCSDPLETLGPVSYTDTITVFYNDTAKIRDTVFIVVTDSSQTQDICSQLNACQKKIFWMFRNLEGNYKLEFTALQDGKKPKQILKVEINGYEYRWKPSVNPELNKELYLEKNTTIKLTTCRPPARGHPIYVCLTLTEL